MKHKFLKICLILCLALLFGGITFASPGTPPLPSTGDTQQIETPAALDENTVVQDTSLPPESNIQTQEINPIEAVKEIKPIEVKDIQASPNDNKALTKKIIPDTSTEIVKMIFMFLKVMLAVVISSVAIFIVLLLMKKFYYKGTNEIKEEEILSKNLESPQNETLALKSFLNKTKGN